MLPFAEQPMVIMATDTDLMFKEPSGELVSFTEEEDYTCKFYEDGIPAFGLENAHLLMVASIKSELTACQPVILFLTEPVQD